MNYLIVYNNTQSFDSQKIHEVVTTMPGITDWWHYLPNVYIVSTTTKNAKSLSDYIIRNFEGLLFFITKIDLNDNNGVLNKNAWDWINKKTNTTIRLKSIQSPPDLLSGLFRTPVKPKEYTSLFDMFGIPKKR